jgi:spore maturation protein CgeB
MFYHSLVSDWNHGNAHFLRGVASELMYRNHEVEVYEPHNGWSLEHLLQEQGIQAVEDFQQTFPHLVSYPYHLETLELDTVLDGADLVLVHEWNDRELIRRIGEHHQRNPEYRLLFHDTHHRSVTDPESMSRIDLSGYDGVLAFGEVIRQIYRERGWAQNVWTWHEAADTRVFFPQLPEPIEGDLVWVGNWGDEERSRELHEFLLQPVQQLGWQASVYGVRYPEPARRALQNAGIRFRGWLPNYRVPQVFARHRVTVHVPRRPYVEALPGIPTIRPFEALACGLPLVCSPWRDDEHLFTPGRDFLVARSGAEMKQHLRMLVNEPAAAEELAQHGYQTIRQWHTCGHRTDELLSIYAELDATPSAERLAS